MLPKNLLNVSAIISSSDKVLPFSSTNVICDLLLGLFTKKGEMVF